MTLGESYILAELEHLPLNHIHESVLTTLTLHSLLGGRYGLNLCSKIMRKFSTAQDACKYIEFLENETKE